MGGVEQADENLFLLDSVLPVLQVPEVPYSASSGRYPFYCGATVAAVVAEFGHVGCFCSSDGVIIRVDRIDIHNTAGAVADFTLARQDNPVTGVVVNELIPAYINAGLPVTAIDTAIIEDTDGGIRGTDLMNGGTIAVAPSGITSIKLTAYIQGGVLWAASRNADNAVTVSFAGEVIPVILAQTGR